MTRTLTPAQAREVRILVARLAALLDDAPPPLEPGDQAVAEVLLPTWAAQLGNTSMTVASLRVEVGPDTPLGEVLARWLARFDDPARAWQALGQLLHRLASGGHVVAGLQVVQRGTQGGVSVWDVRPPGAP